LLLAVILGASACTLTGESSESLIPRPTLTSATQPATTTEVPRAPVADTITRTVGGAPDEVTSFTETLTCDPTAENADAQVVQAFITAYNQRNAVRLHELIQDEEIWDIGGVPHLGEVLWTDALAWAEKGWLVNDELQLIRIIRYGPLRGSDITVRRTNDVLVEAGIDELVLLIKVPGSGCTIERFIAHIRPDRAGACLFYTIYIDVLQEQEHIDDVQVSDGCTS
jgi:hypothetical protein